MIMHGLVCGVYSLQQHTQNIAKLCFLRIGGKVKAYSSIIHIFMQVCIMPYRSAIDVLARASVIITVHGIADGLAKT